MAFKFFGVYSRIIMAGASALKNIPDVDSPAASATALLAQVSRFKRPIAQNLIDEIKKNFEAAISRADDTTKPTIEKIREITDRAAWGIEVKLSDGEVAIETLLKKEKQWLRDGEKIRKLTQGFIKRNPEFADEVKRTQIAYLAANEKLLSFLRDERWRLMALRAQYYPSQPKGNARGIPLDLDSYIPTD